jgi:hypothetical protein
MSNKANQIIKTMKKLHRFIINGVVKEFYAHLSEFNSTFRKLYPAHKGLTRKEIHLKII